MTIVQAPTSCKHTSKRYETKYAHPTVILHFTLKSSYITLWYFLITPGKTLSTHKNKKISNRSLYWSKIDLSASLGMTTVLLDATPWERFSSLIRWEYGIPWSTEKSSTWASPTWTSVSHAWTPVSPSYELCPGWPERRVHHERRLTVCTQHTSTLCIACINE
jgi:hypothetical protein